MVFFELSVFLDWKYFEMTFTSFLDLAGRGGGGGTLLIMTGTDLGDSFFELPLGVGIRGENLEDILVPESNERYD